LKALSDEFKNPSKKRGLPSQVKGAGLRTLSRRGSWVQIPPPAPIDPRIATSIFPNGSYALLAGSGGAVLRPNGTTFQLLNTAGIYSSSLTVRYVSFDPTGSMALVVGDSGLVLTYDGTSLRSLPALTNSILLCQLVSKYSLYNWRSRNNAHVLRRYAEECADWNFLGLPGNSLETQLAPNYHPEELQDYG
jgi:hypothetical protein